jgi:hypothetical protein
MSVRSLCKASGLLAIASCVSAAEPPAVKQPVLFHTEAADAIVSRMQIFPKDNPWHEDVSKWKVAKDSDAIVGSIGKEKPLRYNTDMGFVLVPPNQKRVPLLEVEYKDESDPGPYPIPDKVPIEGWPVYYERDLADKKLSLDDVQRDKLNLDGDRHAIVVDPAAGKVYEFFTLKKTDKGWLASQASIFDLRSNKLRPDGWTSADAAGLPIFPAIIRYDELKRGEIDHALRVTVRRSRKAYVYPATHHASRLTDKNLPRMGERLRLKADYDVSKFSPEVKTILKALKKHGMFVADNGIEWAISCAADPRIPVLHDELRKVKGDAFEVVQRPE